MIIHVATHAHTALNSRLVNHHHLSRTQVRCRLHSVVVKVLLLISAFAAMTETRESSLTVRASGCCDSLGLLLFRLGASLNLYIPALLLVLQLSFKFFDKFVQLFLFLDMLVVLSLLLINIPFQCFDLGE